MLTAKTSPVLSVLNGCQGPQRLLSELLSPYLTLPQAEYIYLYFEPLMLSEKIHYVQFKTVILEHYQNILK